MEVAPAAIQLNLLLQIQAEREAQLVLLLALRRRRRRRHRWWVRPWLTVERRLQYGQYETLMQELRNEDVISFKRYMRITPDMFDEILQRVAPRIQKQDTRFRSALPAGLKLAITIRYMACGDTYTSLAYDFRTASETICHLIPGLERAVFFSLNLLSWAFSCFAYGVSSAYVRGASAFWPIYTRTGSALSWNLPRGFRVASACLPGDPSDSRQLPDQFHVGSSLAPDVFGTVRVLSGRCPKHSRSCSQCRSLQDRLQKTRKPWRQAGCPDDVRTTMRTDCRRRHEVHFRIQILLWTKISTRKIRPLPKAPKRAEAFRGDKDSERNLSGICGEVAESCGLINAAFRVLSASCPGPSGRLALHVCTWIIIAAGDERVNFGISMPWHLVWIL